MVAIRIRPLNAKEVNSGDYDIIRVQDNLIVNFFSFSLSLTPWTSRRRKKKWSTFCTVQRNRDMRSIRSIAISNPKQLFLTYSDLCVNSAAFDKNCAERLQRDSFCIRSYWYREDVHNVGQPGDLRLEVLLPWSSVLAIRDIFRSIESDMDNNY